MSGVLSGKKIGVIGVGKIGEALIQGLLAEGEVRREDVRGSVKHEASAARVRERLGIEVTTDNAAVVKGRDIVILAVKPQGVAAVLPAVRAVWKRSQIMVSVVASVQTRSIEEGLGGRAAVVRVMPNTPCLIRRGMSVLAAGAHAGADQVRLTEAIFRAVGRTCVLEEHLMDAVTGLSGSGPAYMYMVIESLAEAGVKVGIPRDVSTLLSAQTMLGSAAMVLELGEHPALLKDTVTTPAGCTIDGIMALEEGGLRVTFLKAVVEATRRAKELARDSE